MVNQLQSNEEKKQEEKKDIHVVKKNK